MSKFREPMTYFWVILIVVVFLYLVSLFGDFLLDSGITNLSNDSKDYINELSGNNEVVGLDTSFIDEDISNPQLNTSSQNKDDFSVDFNFGFLTTNKFTKFFYVLLNVPQVIIYDLFRLSGLLWLADILDWFWRGAIALLIYTLVRRG